MEIVALHFPPIAELVVWPSFLFEGTPFGFNKIALVNLFAVALTLGLFWVGGSRRALVPRGVQNLAEQSVELIDREIILPTIGPQGLAWGPFLTAMFFFLFFTNIFEVIPVIQMPANARMANPLFLAVLVWVIFNAVGIVHQGLGGYLKSSLFPPGVPAPLYLLVTPIELVSTFIVRPFSLAVRLFANMLAGHILLVTFAVLSAALWAVQWYIVIVPGTFFMLVFVTAFEVLVSILQAYIFTILTAVYIGGAMHPEH